MELAKDSASKLQLFYSNIATFNNLNLLKSLQNPKDSGASTSGVGGTWYELMSPDWLFNLEVPWSLPHVSRVLFGMF